MDIKRVPASKDKIKFGKSANADILGSSPTERVTKDTPPSQEPVTKLAKNNTPKAPQTPSSTLDSASSATATPVTPTDITTVASQAPFDAPITPTSVTPPATQPGQTPVGAKPVTRTMPHKSHFGISIAIAIGAMIVLVGGVALVLMSQKKAVAPTPSVVKAQHYSDASTEIDQLNADIKDMNDRFNDKPLDMTEN